MAWERVLYMAEAIHGHAGQIDSALDDGHYMVRMVRTGKELHRPFDKCAKAFPWPVTVDLMDAQ